MFEPDETPTLTQILNRCNSGHFFNRLAAFATPMHKAVLSTSSGLEEEIESQRREFASIRTEVAGLKAALHQLEKAGSAKPASSRSPKRVPPVRQPPRGSAAQNPRAAPESEPEVNVVEIGAIGDRGVGKTSLLLVAKGHPYPEDSESVVLQNDERIYESPVRLYRHRENERHRIHLVEGGDPRTFNAVLDCFALDDRESLNNIRTVWVPRPWRRWGFTEQAVFLVGTKSDKWDLSAPGAISQGDIDEMASYIGARGVVLCSAKSNHLQVASARDGSWRMGHDMLDLVDLALAEWDKRHSRMMPGSEVRLHSIDSQWSRNQSATVA
jgi:hypothetical protein